MNDLRKAAEMALKFCDDIGNLGGPYPYVNETAVVSDSRKVLQALRQALAMERFSEVNQEIEEALKQPKREWVGLEDEDVATVNNEFNRGALWAEKILKEKNT